MSACCSTGVRPRSSASFPSDSACFRTRTVGAPARATRRIDASARVDAVVVDTRVVIFTFGVALAAGVLFGLLPAFQSVRVDVREALNEARRSGMSGGVCQRRARAGLVVAEIALTIVLTIGAALLVRSFARLQRVSPGFDADRVLPRNCRCQARGTAATSCARRCTDYGVVRDQPLGPVGVDNVCGHAARRRAPRELAARETRAACGSCRCAERVNPEP